MRFLLLAALSLAACAHTSSEVTQLNAGEYLITCDGNGYATQNDAIQCVARESMKACGGSFETIEGNSQTTVEQRTNLFNGNPVSVNHPSSVAHIRCSAH